jgi:predicted nuclease with TOPRIM domain
LKEETSKLPIHTNKSDSKNQKIEEKQQIRNKIAKIIDRLKNNSIDQKLSAQELEQLEKEKAILQEKLRKLKEYQQTRQGSGGSAADERIPFLNIEETIRALQGIDTHLFSPLETEAAQSCEYRKNARHTTWNKIRDLLIA